MGRRHEVTEGEASPPRNAPPARPFHLMSPKRAANLCLCRDDHWSSAECRAFLLSKAIDRKSMLLPIGWSITIPTKTCHLLRSQHHCYETFREGQDPPLQQASFAPHLAEFDRKFTGRAKTLPCIAFIFRFYIAFFIRESAVERPISLFS